MANKRSDYQERERDTMWSGKSGERERHSSGRTPGERGLDSDEMRGHGAISESSRQSNDMSYSDVGSTSRDQRHMSPDLEEDESGSTGDRGFSGSSRSKSGIGNQSSRSSSVAGDPMNKSHTEDPQYRTSSRNDLNREDRDR